MLVVLFKCFVLNWYVFPRENGGTKVSKQITTPLELNVEQNSFGREIDGFRIYDVHNCSAPSEVVCLTILSFINIHISVLISRNFSKYIIAVVILPSF